MGKKFLYGASVQGIQSFIFQTNKLREIVGASELVAEVCTDAFNDYAGSGESIVRAAGNIKHIFTSESECRQAVLNFPRKVMDMAPGITISQAVVTYEKDSDYAKKANELEKLIIAQRNKPVRPMTLGLMAISRAPSTGLPAVETQTEKEKGKIVLLDEASSKKRKKQGLLKLAEKSFGKEQNITEKQIAYEIEDITGNNNWIAIIHADGNGIGNIVRAVANEKEDMKKFSKMLDVITAQAANAAYKAVEGRFGETKKIPLRPVVLSGDDMTMICRGDLAIEYTKMFLEKFEEFSEIEFQKIVLKEKTSKKLIEQGLTACAGIAFVKLSYPFHYGVKLAEALCGRAKKAAKKIDADLAPSCLMFHKVQDSFIEDFEKIVERELKPYGKLSFEYGPYYCGKRATKTDSSHCSITVEELVKNVNKYNPISSQLRQWISTLSDNVEAANQQMRRLRQIKPQVKEIIKEEYEQLSENKAKTIPFYDILSLKSIISIDTKTTKS